jgi:hypothetical protein
MCSFVGPNIHFGIVLQKLVPSHRRILVCVIHITWLAITLTGPGITILQTSAHWRGHTVVCSVFVLHFFDDQRHITIEQEVTVKKYLGFLNVCYHSKIDSEDRRCKRQISKFLANSPGKIRAPERSSSIFRWTLSPNMNHMKNVAKWRKSHHLNAM